MSTLAVAAGRPAKIWLSPLAALALFVAIQIVMTTVVGPGARALAAPHFDLRDLHSQTVFRAVFAITFDWINLGLAIVILRLRGLSFRDVGWGGAGAIWGWLLAGAVVAFLVWSAFFSRVHFLDRAAWLTDRSVFRIALALTIGVTVGICEEGIYRGFVMSQAKDAGAPVLLQIALSGLLFGLAHVGWGGIAGHFDVHVAVTVFQSTAVFGTVFAIVYWLAGRKLMPGIVGHGLFGAIFEPWMIMMGIAGTLHIGH